MPVRINAGRSKYGRKKEYVIPGKVLDARGNTIWQEWDVRNNYRERMPAKLFDAKGNIVSSEGVGLLYDKKGKPLNSFDVSERVSIEELNRRFRTSAHAQERLRWTDRRTREAGDVLGKIEKMHIGDETEAMKLVLKNPFFYEKLLRGQLSFPKNTPLTMAVIRENVWKVFMDSFRQQTSERKGSFDSSRAHVMRNAKTSDLVVARR